LNDGQIPNVRAVRVHVSTGYNRVEGNRRASRNGLVSDLPREVLNVTVRNFVHCCITRLLDCQIVNRYSLLPTLTFPLSDCPSVSCLQTHPCLHDKATHPEAISPTRHRREREASRKRCMHAVSSAASWCPAVHSRSRTLPPHLHPNPSGGRAWEYRRPH
jgi:hypothetical protein